MHVECCYTSRDGRAVDFGFDKEVDRTQTFIPELIEDYGLQEDEFDRIIDFLKAAFVAKRSSEATKLENQRQALGKLSEVERLAIDSMTVVK